MLACSAIFGTAAASAAYPSEAAYVCGAETQPFPVGSPSMLSERSILHPGCGNLIGMQRFGEPSIQAYYRQFGFDRNFLNWAPKQVRGDFAARKHSGCITAHPNGSLCGGGPENVRYTYGPSDDWNGPTTVKVWGDGFIALACGNMSLGGTRQGPVPTISGTKYEDANGNGVRDGGEQGIGGVVIHLYRDGGEVASTTTDGGGSYSFRLDSEANANLSPGTYSLSETVPTGYRQTAGPGATFIDYGAADTTYGGRDFGNQKVTDLGIEKSAAATTIAGETVTWHLTVTNHGHWATPGVVVTDHVPAGLDQIDQLDPACTLTSGTLHCALGTIASGGQRDLSFRSRVLPSRPRGSTITNAATVTSDMPDTNPGNDSDDATTTIDTRADVSIDKTADRESYDGSELVTYTLVAHNDGPSDAQDVVVDDDIPPDLTFVSVAPGAPACTETLGHVHCSLGTVIPGASPTVTIVARANGLPPATNPPPGDTHQLTVSKEEQSVSLQAGEVKTSDLTCSNGGFMVDGAVEIMHVDQGTGSPADVRVERASSVAPGAYRFTVRNTTSGQAQVKLFGTCMPHQTDTGSHLIAVGAAQTLTSGTLAPGRYTFSIPTSIGHRAVSPGIEVLSGAARLVGGEPDGNAWKFTVEVLQTAQVTLSIRSLKDTTGPAAGPPVHVHALRSTHVVEHVTLPPGESVQRVSCPVGYKGIVASYDLPSGVVALGNEPQPINRDFRLLNTTGHPIDVTLDLVCVSIETGPPLDDLEPIVNTATVSTATADPNPWNNVDTATIIVARAAGSTEPPAPAPSVHRVAPPEALAPDPHAQTPQTSRVAAPASPAPATARFGTVAVSSAGTKATVPVTCVGTAACAGTVTLSAKVPASSSRSARTPKAATVVLGKATYRVKPGKTAKVTVTVPRRYRALAKSGRVRTATVSAGRTHATSQVVVTKANTKRSSGR